MMTTLPSKEAAIFKNLLKLYEYKQYKKGVKHADGILKKVPNHGETQAMKALFLCNLERKEEAKECIEMALKNDPNSHICWHVSGLMERTKRNYQEACKCYIQALKIDQQNVQIMRDLAQIQMHLRQYAACIETRKKVYNIMLKRGQNATSQLLYIAVCQHMMQQYQDCLETLSIFEQNITLQRSVEVSEFLLYKCMVLEECNQITLGNYQEIEKYCLDQVVLREKIADLLLKTNPVEAMNSFMDLIRMNPNNRNYIQKFILATKQPSVDVLKDLISQFDSMLMQIMLLEQVEADSQEFYTFANLVLENGFKKQIPSLFSLLKIVLKNKEKNKIIEKILYNHDSEYALFFKAQLLDLNQKYNEALELVRDPKVVEFVMFKARILKHKGLTNLAQLEMRKAMEMDPQDRFVNNKYAKYLCRDSKLKEAIQTMSKFTNPKAVDVVKDLVELQCLWFLIDAEMFNHVMHVYEDLEDDLFYFHSFCITKMTLRTYIDLLRMKNHLKFKKPFTAMIHSYLKEDLVSKMENLSLNQVNIMKVIQIMEQTMECKETHKLALMVYIHQKKWLLALRSLRREAEYGITQEFLVDVALLKSSSQVEMPEKFKEAIENELKKYTFDLKYDTLLEICTASRIHELLNKESVFEKWKPNFHDLDFKTAMQISQIYPNDNLIEMIRNHFNKLY